MANANPVTVQLPQEVGRRLQHADQHLLNLDQEVRNYLLNVPFKISIQTGATPTQRLIYCDVNPPFDELEWAMRSSDIVHNYRSSLDNLVYVISCTTQNKAVSGTEYPVYLLEKDWLKNNKGPSKIGKLPQGAQQVLEARQLWHHNGTSDPLWHLHELDNADKHRTPNVTLADFSGATYKVIPQPDVTISNQQFFPGPLVARRPIGSVDIVKTGDPAATITVEYTPTFTIVFGDAVDQKGNPLPTNGLAFLKTLKFIRESVWDAAAALQTYFANGVPFGSTAPWPPPTP